MRLVIAAVGKLKDGPERELFARYADRIPATGRAVGLGSLEVREVPEGRGQTAPIRMADEAQRLIEKCRDTPVRVLLDERGKSITSAAFAKLIRDWRDSGEAGAAFLLGGPDGHGDAARAAAKLTLSLGPMTLPHGLARIILAEQLYRAGTILAGHPYHRA